jgi:hypothetical protein
MMLFGPQDQKKEYRRVFSPHQTQEDDL